MSGSEILGTDCCERCAIMNEKMIQLAILEKDLKKREEELDKELIFIRNR